MSLRRLRTARDFVLGFALTLVLALGLAAVGVVLAVGFAWDEARKR